jgi:membrane-associated protease RseP (regulator of RpoE activity)
MNLGASVLTAVPVSFFISGGHTDYGSNGLLGNEVLSRFNLIFDYPNERMFIKPNQSFPVPLYLDRSGLLIRPHRLGAVVKSVAKDSAAYAIGLKTNDLITSIDGTLMTHLNITELKRLLSSEREAVSVCWMLADEQTCGELALTSRLQQDE